MPKFPPPPRSAQNRSGSEVGDAVRTDPSAQTTRAERRLSIVRPYLRRTQPSPPPSVSPATPVSDTTPPGTTRPKACVSRSTSPHNAPPWTRAMRGVRIDLHAAHPREIDDHAAIAARVTRHGVAATADGDEETMLAGEPDGVDHIGRPRTPHDERGTALMHGVENRLVPVSGVTGLQHVSADRRTRAARGAHRRCSSVRRPMLRLKSP